MDPMILVRDVFRLKFGAAREALAAFKEIGETAKRAGFRPDAFRILTDLVGSYYTLVLESTHENLAEYEQSSRRGMADAQWRAAYGQFTPFVESGHREIFTIVQ
jgi:hypothetical protein